MCERTTAFLYVKSERNRGVGMRRKDLYLNQSPSYPPLTRPKYIHTNTKQARKQAFSSPVTTPHPKPTTQYRTATVTFLILNLAAAFFHSSIFSPAMLRSTNYLPLQSINSTMNPVPSPVLHMQVRVSKKSYNHTSQYTTTLYTDHRVNTPAIYGPVDIFRSPQETPRTYNLSSVPTYVSFNKRSGSAAAAAAAVAVEVAAKAEAGGKTKPNVGSF